MEPTIYKPSIYKGAGIYKTGVGGFVPEFDGVKINWIIKNTATSYFGGIIQDDNKYAPNKDGSFKWSISKKNPVDISNFNLLELKFKMYLDTADGGDSCAHLFASNNSDEFIDMDWGSALSAKLYVKKKNGTQISSFSLGTLSKYNWHYFNIILNKTDSIVFVKIDDVVKVNSSMDFTQIDTSSFVPGFGTYRTTPTCFLTNGIYLGREMSLKVDGVETFDTL